MLSSCAADAPSLSFEGMYDVGTLGTGGAFRGLAVRLGVPAREPPLVFLAVGFVGDFEGVAGALSAEFSSMVLVISWLVGAGAELFLRLASTEGDDSRDGSGSSLASMVLRRFLLRIACCRGVAGLGE